MASGLQSPLPLRAPWVLSLGFVDIFVMRGKVLHCRNLASSVDIWSTSGIYLYHSFCEGTFEKSPLCKPLDSGAPAASLVMLGRWWEKGLIQRQ